MHPKPSQRKYFQYIYIYKYINNVYMKDTKQESVR